MNDVRHADNGLFSRSASLSCPSCGMKFWIPAGALASASIHCAHCAFDLALTREQRLALWGGYLHGIGLSMRAAAASKSPQRRAQPR